MTMTTRCPHCGTAFKVVADQLRVRNGLVRCGVCSRVFDGYAAVVDGTPPPAFARPSAVRPDAHDAPDAPQYQGAGSPVLSVQAPMPEPHSPPAVAHPPASGSRSTAHAMPETTSGPIREPAYREPASTFPRRPPFQEPPAAAPSRPAAPPRDARPSHQVPPPPWDTPAVPPARGPVASPPAGAAAPAIPPAVLRGRDDNRRGGHGQAGAEQERHSDHWGDNADGDDDEVGFREPYAPYRQDDIDDAEQQARDMAPARGDRYRIYARRDVMDDEPEYMPIPGEARTRYDDTVDTGMAPPVFMDEEVQRRRSLIARLWALGCLLGLIVLGLQSVYVYRTSIAAALPALRPALDATCRQLGCEVGYGRRLERISFTSSSLQPPSGAAGMDDGRMRLVLAVTMRNRYDKPQPWPALVLQLTDLSDTVVVRKVILPENYLPPGTRGPFPANGEQSISVPLQVIGLHVNGYQLDKFFP